MRKVDKIDLKLKSVFHKVNHCLDLVDRIMKLINRNIVKSILNYRLSTFQDVQNFSRYHNFFTNAMTVEKAPFFNCFISNCELYNIYSNRVEDLDCGFFYEMEMLNSSYHNCIFNLKNQDLYRMKINGFKNLKILKIYLGDSDQNDELTNYYKFFIKDENHIYRGIKNCIFKYKAYKKEHKKILKNLNSNILFDDNSYHFFRIHPILDRRSKSFNFCVNL